MNENLRWLVKQGAKLDQVREQVREWFGRCMTDDALYAELFRFVDILKGDKELTGGDLTLAKLLTNLHICQLAVERFEKIQMETENDS